MDAVTDTILDEETPRARLALLLSHFSQLDDAREPWRVLYPLHEVLLLVTCATIASCDDFDDIVAWGNHHLGLASWGQYSAILQGFCCHLDDSQRGPFVCAGHKLFAFSTHNPFSVLLLQRIGLCVHKLCLFVV